jgi:hypothetical protein
MRCRETLAVYCKNYIGHTRALECGIAGVKSGSESTARYPCVNCCVSYWDQYTSCMCRHEYSRRIYYEALIELCIVDLFEAGVAYSMYDLRRSIANLRSCGPVTGYL